MTSLSSSQQPPMHVVEIGVTSGLNQMSESKQDSDIEQTPFTTNKILQVILIKLCPGITVFADENYKRDCRLCVAKSNKK